MKASNRFHVLRFIVHVFCLLSSSSSSFFILLRRNCMLRSTVLVDVASQPTPSVFSTLTFAPFDDKTCTFKDTTIIILPGTRALYAKVSTRLPCIKRKVKHKVSFACFLSPHHFRTNGAYMLYIYILGGYCKLNLILK